MAQDTFNVFGMDLPVIKELGDGYFLVAHKNAPGIANEHSLTAMEFIGGEHDGVPLPIRRAAIDAYTKFSWPLVKDKFTWTFS